MPIPTPTQIVDSIRSDKSTQRHEGLRNLKEWLGQDCVLQDLENRAETKAWIATFQALFTANRNEKEIILKKGLDAATDAAIKKLTSVSEHIRWTIERGLAHVTYKAIKPLVQHCLEISVYNDQLFMPVAFPCLQAIRAVLSYAPHRDRIKPETWLEILSLSFDILIEDSISKYFTADEDEEEEVEQMAFDESMDVDVSMEQTDEDAAGPSTGRKRARTAATPTTKPKARAIPRAKARHIPLSREQICAAEMIHLLLTSPYAVFHHPDFPHLTRAILNKFRRFLEMFPQLTTVHHHIIHGIILTLCHAEMNCHADVISFGKRTWSYLLALWQKRDNIVKEGLVMIFTILLPFVTRSQSDFLEYTDLEKLQNFLITEAELCAQSKGLTFDDIRLKIDLSESNSPYHSRTFQCNERFSAKQAHFWSALELHAACLAKVGLTHLKEDNLMHTPDGCHYLCVETSVER